MVERLDHSPYGTSVRQAANGDRMVDGRRPGDSRRRLRGRATAPLEPFELAVRGQVANHLRRRLRDAVPPGVVYGPMNAARGVDGHGSGDVLGNGRAMAWGRLSGTVRNGLRRAFSRRGGGIGLEVVHPATSVWFSALVHPAAGPVGGHLAAR